MNKSPRPGSLFVIFLTVFIDLLGFGMVLPLLPIYADQFSTDESGAQLGLMMAIFSVMQFFFAPLWGRLSDRIGRRPVLMLGLASSMVFYFLFGVATTLRSFWLLFATRVGAGIAGATISTAQAYIADTTTLENRSKGMALVGMAFGLGFTIGPLFGFLAVPKGNGDPGPWPGYAAAILSGIALLSAVFLLPESLPAAARGKAPATGESGGHAAPRRTIFDFAAFRQALAMPSIGMLLAAIFVCVFSFANFETTLSLLIKGERRAASQATPAGSDLSAVNPGSDADSLPVAERPPTTRAGESVDSKTPFRFTWSQVCMTYAFIGLTLAVIQGGVVRRLSGRVPEGTMAGGGALTELVGFGLVAWAVHIGSIGMLFGALVVIVGGFAFMQPTLNSLLSRRSDPRRQGLVLGVGQSVNSLARIFGSGLGIPLLKQNLLLPYALAAGLMGLGWVMVAIAVRQGKDYQDAKS